MSYKGEDNIDEPEFDRWYEYKRRMRAMNHEPLSWGEWLAAGQPLPEEE